MTVIARFAVLGWLLVTVVSVLLLGSPAAASGAVTDHRAGELIVRFAGSPGNDRARSLRARYDLQRLRALPLRGTHLVRVPATASVRAVARSLSRSPDVVYAEPNVVYRTQAVPNDAFLDDLWGLRNRGQSAFHAARGTPGADIDAVRAWDITTGDPATRVAVLDTGVHAAHPDLAANIATGAAETATTDPNGHGTHVAGTIGAVGNDRRGITGVAWRVGVLPVRVLEADGSGDAVDIANGIVAAVRGGARVVNMSFSGGYSNLISQAMRQARDTLFVAAAGNGNDYMDGRGPRTYPCASTHENLVCVAASDATDSLAGFSRRGEISVDLAAPGTNVRSTYPPVERITGDDMEGEVHHRWALGHGWAAASDWSVSGTQSLQGTSLLGDGAVFLTDVVDRGRCRVRFFADAPGPAEWRLEVRYASGWFDSGRFYGPSRGYHSVLLEGPWERATRFRFWLVSRDTTVFIDDVEFVCPSAQGPGGYESFDGTSMAAPHVTGVAALLLSRFPEASPRLLKARLLETVDRLPSLDGVTVTGGRLNAYRALSEPVAEPAPPEGGTIDTVLVGGGLREPWRVRATRDGGALVTDRKGNAVWRMAPNGPMHLVAGTPGSDGAFAGDGGPATAARLDRPMDAVEVADGSVLIADTWNARIRRVAPDGTLTTIAGTHGWAHDGDGGAAAEARLDQPVSVATRPDGGYLIAEGGGWVRSVDPDGIITTVAGNGTWTVKERVPATESGLNHPISVAASDDGGFLVVDGSDHRVRKVDRNGVIRTVAGTGAPGFAGDGGPATQARLEHPTDVAEIGDALVISDGGNHRVRHIDRNGVIRTVAGGASYGLAGDGGPALDAELGHPSGVATEDGAVLIADVWNRRIRRATLHSSLLEPPPNPPSDPSDPPSDTPVASPPTGERAVRPPRGARESADSDAANTRRRRTLRLRVVPRRVRAGGRRPRMKITVSARARVRIRLQVRRRGQFRRVGQVLNRRLPPGITWRRLPARVKGRRLRPGRYRLVARVPRTRLRDTAPLRVRKRAGHTQSSPRGPFRNQPQRGRSASLPQRG